MKVWCGSDNFDKGRWLFVDLCARHASFTGILESSSASLTRYQEHCKTGGSILFVRTHIYLHINKYMINKYLHNNTSMHRSVCAFIKWRQYYRITLCVVYRICLQEMTVIVHLRALTSTRSIVVIVIMGEFLSRLFEIYSRNYSGRSCCLSAQEQEDLDRRIDDFEKKHDKYVVHIVRGYHEINENNRVLCELPVGEVVEVSDWKMKFMMYRFRCAYMPPCIHKFTADIAPHPSADMKL